MNIIRLSDILKLFEEESCKNKVDYELIKTNCHDNTRFWSFTIWSFTIYYYTNLWSIEHKQPNELKIVIDNDKKVMGIEFESAGDRCSRTPAWKMICRCVSEELTFDIDLKEK